MSTNKEQSQQDREPLVPAATATAAAAAVTASLLPRGGKGENGRFPATARPSCRDSPSVATRRSPPPAPPSCPLPLLSFPSRRTAHATQHFANSPNSSSPQARLGRSSRPVPRSPPAVSAADYRLSPRCRYASAGFQSFGVSLLLRFAYACALVPAQLV